MTDNEIENSVSQVAPLTAPVKPVAAIWHTAGFIIILLGFAALQARPQVAAAASHLPSRVTLYLYTLGYELFLLGYVWLLGLMLYKVPIMEVIGGKWRRWGDFWRDMGVAVLFWIVVAAMLLVLSFTLHFSGVEAAKYLLPQTTVELAVFVVLACAAGFCEELIFRGYLQRQFTAWTGNVPAGIALQGVVFGAAHLYQGVKGVVVISIYGAMFGILAAMRKSLRPGMIQHCAQDTFSGIAYHLATKYKILQMIRF